jgi:hypothetical protein
MAEEKAPPFEKKIIIDENWKSQVEAEKEQAAAEERPKDLSQHAPIPPASISFLFSTLATQALVSLGLLPNPITDKTESDLDQAKHFIDMLGVLQEKTKGNLSAREKQQLDALLFDLRLKYIEACKK